MDRAQTIRLLPVSCAALLLSVAWTGTSRATAPFSSLTRSDLAIGPQNSVAIVDLNRDGKADLATAFYAAYVTVFLGNGDGTFGAPSNVPIGTSGALSVTAADINGDGNPDLVAGSQNAPIVSVLLGAGDGTFRPLLSFATGATMKFVRVADFNSDGRPDVIVVGSGLSVFLGNGDGTFGPRKDVAVNGCAIGEPLSADFNADGRLDLAVPNPCPFGAVSILLGNVWL
jgi:hypothetical protein